MRSLIFIIFSIFFCNFLAAQNNVVKGGGILYTNGVPTVEINQNSDAEFAVDTTTGYWYEFGRDCQCFIRSSRVSISDITVAPTQPPGDKDPLVIINSVDSIYRWRAGVWRHVNKGGSGTVSNIATSGGLTGGPITTTGTISIADGGVTAAKINQMSATTGQVLKWNGSAWAATDDSTYWTKSGNVIRPTITTNQLGIGTTTAHTSTTMATIKGTTNDNSIGFAITNTGSTPSLLINNSGKVRINGTSASSYNLEVTGNALVGNSEQTDYAFWSGGSGSYLWAGTPAQYFQSTAVNTSGGRTEFLADFTGSIFRLHPSSGAAGTDVKVQTLNKEGTYAFQVDLVNSQIGIGTGTLTGGVDFSAVKSGLNVPRWTTSQRGSGTTANFISYNTDSSKYEAKLRNTSSTYGALVLTPSYSPTSGQVLKHNGTDWVAGTDNNSGGTVTSITTGTGLTGGPITTAGTISVASGGISATELATDAVTNTKIANNAVNTAEIVDAAVTAAKINSMSATSEQFLKYNGSAWAPDSIGYNALKYALKFYLDSLRTNNIYFQSDSIRDDTRNVRMDGDGTQVLQVGNFPADDLFDADGYGLRVQKGYSGLSTNTDSHYSVLDLGGTYAALSHGTYSNIAGNVSAEFYAGGVFRNQLLSANSKMVKNSGNLIRGRFLVAQQNTALNTYFLAEETVSGSGTQRHYSGYSGSIDTVTGKANAYISAGFRMDTSARRHSLWLGVGSNPTAGLDTCFVFYTDRGLSINQMLTLRSSWDFSNSSIKFFDKYYVPNATPSTTSGVKQAMVWTGNGTTATPAFETVGNSAHTIQTTTTGGSTTTMAHRTNLDFVDNSGQTGIDFTLTDDNVNGKTKVQATIPNVYAGTYTPTETHSSSTATISSVTVRDAHYIRVGFEVHVTGSLTITSTATGSVVSEITLPIASNFTASADCFGTAVRTKASTTAFAQPYADANSTSDKIRFTYQVGSGTEDTDLQFSVIYTIK